MALRDYQKDIAIDILYEIRLTVPSGLGETISPRITSIGGLVTIYGSEHAPTDLTKANIATKMALIQDDVAAKAFVSIPNYICLIQKSGTITELVLTSIKPEDEGTVVPAS